MSTHNIALAPLVQGFFHDWLIKQRGLSAHTVRSYRDTWKLFLRYSADRHGRPVAKLGFRDLGAPEVLAFLDHLERDRHTGVGTRNCRLAALRSFFSFVATREPLALAQCSEALHIQLKRSTKRPPSYLEPQEIEAILRQPDRSRVEGQRDHTLLSFLYNTGARIQEALDVRIQDVNFAKPFCVRLLGKGRKERVCPLWPETVVLLRSLLARQPRGDEQRIFVSRYGEPLGASGVRFKLAQYVAEARKAVPSLAQKRVTPHTFRHSAAVSLVSAGVDVTVIRNWLGHASLDTTNLYAQANLATKCAALELVEPPASRPPRWRRDPGLLEWLDSL